MTDWRHTKRAWARLKLSLAEVLVLSCIEDGRGFRSPPKNLAIVAASDEIRGVKAVYFAKEDDDV